MILPLLGRLNLCELGQQPYSLTPEEGKQEAISERPKLIVHWMTAATNSPKMTLLGPAYARFWPKQLR